LRGLIAGSVTSRVVSFAGTLIALTVAVMLLTNAGVLLVSTSGLLVPAQLANPYPQSDLIVQGSSRITSGSASSSLQAPRPIPASALTAIRGVDGVAVAAGDADLYAQVIGARAVTSGHPWAIAGFDGARVLAGSSPDSAGAVAVDQSLATGMGLEVGDAVRVQTADGPASSYRVSAITSPMARPSVFFASDPPSFFLIAVRLLPGASPDAVASRIRASAPGLSLNVEATSAYLAGLDAAAGQDYSSTAKLLTIMAIIAAVIATFVVASTFSFAVLQRTREIGLLRATGATPNQVRRLIIGEGLVLSLVAGAAGCALGYLLAVVLSPRLAALGLVPAHLTLVLNPLPFVAAFGTGVLVTLIASAASTQRAVRVAPVEVLRSASLEPKRIGWVRMAAGIGFVAFGALLVLVPGTTPNPDPTSGLVLLNSLVLVASLAFLGPLLARPFASVLGWLAERAFGAAGTIARRSSLVNGRRLASAAAPLALTVALAGSVIGMTAAEASRPVGLNTPGMRATLVITSSSPYGVPPSVPGSAASLADVSAASELRPVTITVPYSNGGQPNLVAQQAVAMDPKALPELLDLGVDAGSLSAMDDGSMAISDLAAYSSSRLGGVEHVIMPDGYEADLRVVVVFRHYEGFYDTVLPSGLVDEHARGAPVAAVLVRTSGGGDAAAHALASLYPTTTAVSGAEFAASSLAAERAANQMSAASLQQFLSLFIGLTVAYAALAIVNTLAMATAQRRREFALLRVVGAQRGQVATALVVETAVVVAMGVGLGLAFVAAPLGALAIGLTGGAAFAMNWDEMGTILGSCAVLAVLGTVVPAALAMRTRPIELVGAPG
jgi:putative ABC transport system permease protein